MPGELVGTDRTAHVRPLSVETTAAWTVCASAVPPQALFGTFTGPSPKGPPPSVWWSMPEPTPPPSVGLQLSPSVSVKQVRLARTGAGISWDSKVRAGVLSVNRMGSKVVVAVHCGRAGLLSSQAAVAGETVSSNVTRNVWVFACTNARPERR